MKAPPCSRRGVPPGRAGRAGGAGRGTQLVRAAPPGDLALLPPETPAACSTYEPGLAFRAARRNVLARLADCAGRRRRNVASPAAAFVVAVVLACVLASAFAGDSAAPGGPAVRDVSAALAKIRAGHDVPGLVALTLEGDRIAATGAAGVRRRGGAAPVTVDDPFHLGSCTKAMTATLCAALVAEGRLAWDDRPASALAKHVKRADDGWKDSTLDLLLRNRGGAPATLDADGLWTKLWKHPGPARDARRALAAEVLARKPEAPPGTKSIYSNAGFSIAGAMAEETADASYEDLLRKHVLRPLGMDRTGFGPPSGTNAPRGHGADGKPVEPGPGADNPDAIAPAGKVHAPLGDWAKFVGLHLRRGRGAPGTLAKLDFARMHTPSEGADYAMGWGTGARAWAKGAAPGDVGRVLTHTGSNTMWFAAVWMAPECDFAVLAACNQGGDAGAAACDAAVAELIRDRAAVRDGPR